MSLEKRLHMDDVPSEFSAQMETLERFCEECLEDDFILQDEELEALVHDVERAFVSLSGCVDVDRYLSCKINLLSEKIRVSYATYVYASCLEDVLSAPAKDGKVVTCH